MVGHPDESFYTAFNTGIRQSIANKLRTTYHIVGEGHDPQLGFNQNTYAIGIYHVAVFQLGSLASQFDGSLSMQSMNPKFRLGVGDYSLACHRVGGSMFDDIAYCFPSPESAAGEMVPKASPSQMELPFLDQPSTLGLQRSIVLAHFGNPNEGFLKAYLCFPTRQIGGRIVEWGFADPLTEDMPGANLAKPTIPTLDFPPEESIEEFKVTPINVEDSDVGA